jgi:hypothetical protein
MCHTAYNAGGLSFVQAGLRVTMLTMAFRSSDILT